MISILLGYSGTVVVATILSYFAFQNAKEIDSNDETF